MDFQEKLADMNRRLKEIKDIFNEEGQKILAEALKPFLAEYPVTWTQGTPTWNDGEECYFDVKMLSFIYPSKEEALVIRNDPEGKGWYWPFNESNEEDKSVFMECGLKKGTEQEQALHSLFETIPNELLEFAFGEREVKIVATLKDSAVTFDIEDYGY